MEAAYAEASKDPEKTKEVVTVQTLETKERKRPLILGEEMDAAVQQYIESLKIDSHYRQHDCCDGSS